MRNSLLRVAGPVSLGQMSPGRNPRGGVGRAGSEEGLLSVRVVGLRRGARAHYSAELVHRPIELQTREAVRLIRRFPVDCRSELLASPEACVRRFALLH